MTFDLGIKKYDFIKNKETQYQSLFNLEEYSKLMILCKKVFNKEYVNGGSVRLDEIRVNQNHTRLVISQIKFYDFITSNFTLLNIEKLFKEANESEKHLLERLMNRYENEGKANDISSVLSKTYLSNPLAVSCLIKDKVGRFLLTKRNGFVGISNNFYSTTVTGSVDNNDFKTKDPVINCCIREIAEELAYTVNPEDVNFYSIVTGVNKLQPIALTNILVDNLETIVRTLKEYSGFNEENSAYYIVSASELKEIINNKRAMMTEAARTHLEGAIGY